MKINRILGIILIFLFTMLLNIRTDGFFPFNPNTNQSLLYASSLVTVALAFTLAAYVLRAGGLGSRSLSVSRNLKSVKARASNQANRQDAPEKSVPTGRLAIMFFLIILANFIIYAVLTIRNANNFSSFTNLNIPVLFGVIFLTAAAVAVALWSKRVVFLLGALVTAFITLSLVQIIYFPITAKQADLMPIIIAQGEAFLKGQNIYQYYLLDNGVWTQAVRQPGSVIAYLPAVVLNFDPRILSLLYTFLTILLISRLAYPKFSQIKFNSKFLLTTLLISLFAFFPYRLVRLDLYEPPFWLLFSAAIFFLKQKKYSITSMIWGFGIFTQVWFWLFTPFYFLFLYKQIRLKRAVLYSGLTILTALALLLPFILVSPEDYYSHVFGYYQGVTSDGIFYANNYYLTPIFHLFRIGNLLQIVQLAAMSVVGLSAIIFMKTFRDFLAYLSVAFLVFIQFNSLTWNYFYINFVMFLVIFLLFRYKNLK